MCRHCGVGRILSFVESDAGLVTPAKPRPTKESSTLDFIGFSNDKPKQEPLPVTGYRCSNCGHETGKLKELCFCGHHYPSGASSRVRCVPNPEKTPEFPHEVVLMQELVQS
jgi:hypothetical protein